MRGGKGVGRCECEGRCGEERVWEGGGSVGVGVGRRWKCEGRRGCREVKGKCEKRRGCEEVGV